MSPVLGVHPLEFAACRRGKPLGVVDGKKLFNHFAAFLLEVEVSKKLSGEPGDALDQLRAAQDNRRGFRDS